MLETIKFMLPPFIAAFIIVGMHAYLGIHVIKRGIIFVDLAFAQIAALGAIVCLLFNLSAKSGYNYYFSFGFILIGSLIFSFVKSGNKQIPKEAIIGIVYGLSLAIAMVIADKISGGGEHIREILTGNILWVNWSIILKILITYIVIAVIHFFARKKFTAITNDYASKNSLNRSASLWDFLFFITFGIVITLSVPIAGVLLVFSFLIIPATISVIFAKSWKGQIAIGWIVGVLSILLGFWYSYVYNAPSCPAVICILGIFLILIYIFKFILKNKIAN